jgi:hypothetical protein
LTLFTCNEIESENWEDGFCVVDLHLFLFSFSFYGFIYYDAPLDSLMDSIANPKVKTTEGKRIRACSLARNTLGVEGHARASG